MLGEKGTKETSHSWSQYLLKGDIYSRQAYLSINGSKRVYSLIGLLVTITVCTTLIGFGAFKGVILLQRSQYETQMASILRPINYSEPQMIQINEHGFDFAVHASFPLPLEVGNLIIYHEVIEQIYNETLGSKVRVQTLKELEYETCSIETFNHSDKAELVVKNIDDYYCLKDRSQMQIGGSYTADLYQTVFVEVNPCRNGSEVVCLPEEEIFEIMSKGWIEIRFVDFYFDKDDKDMPVKSYINDQYFFGIIPEYKSSQEIKIKLSKAIFDDGFLPWSPRKELEFPQVEETFTTLSLRSENQPYMIIAFKLNFFSNIYQKTLYSFTDFISEIGGLFNALYGGGWFIMFLFLDSYILKSILVQLYTFSNSEMTQKTTFLERQYNFEGGKGSETEYNTAILKEAIQRERVTFSKPCLDFCLFRACRNQNLSQKQAQLFEVGRRKLRYDLDIVSLYRMMSEFSIVKKLLLTKNQRVLLKWQQRFTLRPDDAQSLQRFAKKKERLTQKASDSTNPYAMMKEVDKLKVALDEISAKNDANHVDSALMKGIVSSNYDRIDKFASTIPQSTLKKHKQGSRENKPEVGMTLQRLKQKGKNKQKKSYLEVGQSSFDGRESSLNLGKQHIANEKRLQGLRKHQDKN